MDNSESPAETFLKSKSSKEWSHGQAVADFFGILYVLAEPEKAGKNGESISLTWEALSSLMDQAVPEGKDHSEVVGPSSLKPEKIRAAISYLHEVSELDRLALLLASEIKTLGALLLEMDRITDASFMQDGFLSASFFEITTRAQGISLDRDELLSSHPDYVGDEILISYFRSAIDGYTEFITWGVGEVLRDSDYPGLSAIREAFESHIVYAKDWREREIAGFEKADERMKRSEQRAVSEKGRSEYATSVARRKKSKNQNFLVTAGLVVLLILVFWLWKRYVG
jgi:hypothetical protein